MSGLLIGVGTLALMIGAILLRGWALVLLWGWFAVPIFHLPVLTLAQCLGVALVVGAMTYQYLPPKEGEKWEPMVACLLHPLIVAAIGWVVKGFAQ